MHEIEYQQEILVSDKFLLELKNRGFIDYYVSVNKKNVLKVLNDYNYNNFNLKAGDYYYKNEEGFYTKA